MIQTIFFTAHVNMSYAFNPFPLFLLNVRDSVLAAIKDHVMDISCRVCVKNWREHGYLGPRENKRKKVELDDAKFISRLPKSSNIL